MENKNTLITAEQLENDYSLALTSPNYDIIAEYDDLNQPIIRASTTSEETTLFNAVNGGAKTVKSILGDDIYVTDIVITSVQVHSDRDNENSLLVSKAVTHFFTEDGDHYSTLSNGIARAAANLLSCGMFPTPDKPLHIKFKTTETPKGIAHTFDLIK